MPFVSPYKKVYVMNPYEGINDEIFIKVFLTPERRSADEIVAVTYYLTEADEKVYVTSDEHLADKRVYVVNPNFLPDNLRKGLPMPFLEEGSR